jgi:hypothetical protein
LLRHIARAAQMQRYTPNSDHLLRCREMTRWANFSRTHPQQKQQAISLSDRDAGATRLNNPANNQAPLSWTQDVKR